MLRRLHSVMVIGYKTTPIILVRAILRFHDATNSIKNISNSVDPLPKIIATRGHLGHNALSFLQTNVLKVWKNKILKGNNKLQKNCGIHGSTGNEPEIKGKSYVSLGIIYTVFICRCVYRASYCNVLMWHCVYRASYSSVLMWRCVYRASYCSVLMWRCVYRASYCNVLMWRCVYRASYCNVLMWRCVYRASH